MIEELTADEMFFREYGKSKNFMTPTIVMRDVIVPNRYAVELSRGRGFDDETIWGVTFVSFHQEAGSVHLFRN